MKVGISDAHEGFARHRLVLNRASRAAEKPELARRASGVAGRADGGVDALADHDDLRHPRIRPTMNAGGYCSHSGWQRRAALTDGGNDREQERDQLNVIAAVPVTKSVRPAK
jgi:hypothetical protein